MRKSALSASLQMVQNWEEWPCLKKSVARRLMEVILPLYSTPMWCISRVGNGFVLSFLHKNPVKDHKDD